MERKSIRDKKREVRLTMWTDEEGGREGAAGA